MAETLEAVLRDVEWGPSEAAEERIKGLKGSPIPAHEAEYAKSLLRQRRGDWMGAIEGYEKVLAAEPKHRGSLFHLAFLADLRGDVEAAIQYYRECIAGEEAPINALMNLALLLEEEGRFDEAANCLESVLIFFPEHDRARLFWKDLEGTRKSLQEDDSVRPTRPASTILDMPIADFELSVRSRNCLKQMNIHTMRDLINTSEAELLSYKNFGETSLNEIKALLVSRGLSLGRDGKEPAAAPLEPIVPEGDPSLLARSVTELELSVRSRRCLQRLGVHSLADLVVKTEAELLATKNFGQTSLQEVKHQLDHLGLKLRAAKIHIP